VPHSEQLNDAFESVVRLSQNSFGNGSVYLEKFIRNAKHVEVQIFGDGQGDVIALGIRDCSAQRRHQKVLEETPVPGLDANIQTPCFKSAILLGNAVNTDQRARSNFYSIAIQEAITSSK